jgi:hypothetical protein
VYSLDPVLLDFQIPLEHFAELGDTLTLKKSVLDLPALVVKKRIREEI